MLTFKSCINARHNYLRFITFGWWWYKLNHITWCYWCGLSHAALLLIKLLTKCQWYKMSNENWAVITEVIKFYAFAVLILIRDHRVSSLDHRQFQHWLWGYIDGLVQVCIFSIAKVLESRLSCTNPSIWFGRIWFSSWWYRISCL